MFSSRIHTRRTILGRKRGTMGPLEGYTDTWKFRLRNIKTDLLIFDCKLLIAMNNEQVELSHL